MVLVYVLICGYITCSSWLYRGLSSNFGVHHSVLITDEALVAAAKLSAKYVPDRQLPDKSIDLLDEACSRVAIRWEKEHGCLQEVSPNGGGALVLPIGNSNGDGDVANGSSGTNGAVVSENESANVHHENDPRTITQQIRNRIMEDQRNKSRMSSREMEHILRLTPSDVDIGLDKGSTSSSSNSSVGGVVDGSSNPSSGVREEMQEEEDWVKGGVATTTTAAAKATACDISDSTTASSVDVDGVSTVSTDKAAVSTATRLGADDMGEVTAQDIADVVSRSTGIPLGSLLDTERLSLLGMIPNHSLVYIMT